MNDFKEIPVFSYDLVDAVCHCHAALAQDSPHDERHYLNIVMNLLFAYLPHEERAYIDEYLAEKKYLPPCPPLILD
tara:strand:- start:1983 stop:2210 length:228 start_codon:yes stop_codon:yes gene_type:complete